MKDAIIVRKVTSPFSHEWNDWRRRNEKTTGIIFDYSVTYPRTRFSRRKDHAPNQKTRTEDNNHFFKESRTKIRRRNKKEQVAYLKEHEQEIVDYVRAQNSKIESVQIDWTDVRWSDGGFLFPDYSIEVYGTVNHIEDSGWSASMPINDDDSIDLKKISIFNHITIGEEILE